MNPSPNRIPAWTWWGKRLLHYNVSLVIAGILAFACYAAIVWSNRHLLGAEITFFTSFLQGLGYLAMMGVANLCYCAGPILEVIIKPKRPELYRVRAYKYGYWFSVSLPFSLPGILLFLVVFMPQHWVI